MTLNVRAFPKDRRSSPSSTRSQADHLQHCPRRATTLASIRIAVFRFGQNSHRIDHVERTEPYNLRSFAKEARRMGATAFIVTGFAAC